MATAGDISHLARRSGRRHIPGLHHTRRGGHGGSGRRAPHPGPAGTRSRGAMELQGRQVRLVLCRNQRHAQAHVHDPAQRHQSGYAGHRRAHACVSRRFAIWSPTSRGTSGRRRRSSNSSPAHPTLPMAHGACSRPTSSACRSFASASSVFSARTCATFCANTTSTTSSSARACWSMPPRSKCIRSIPKTGSAI